MKKRIKESLRSILQMSADNIIKKMIVADDKEFESLYNMGMQINFYSIYYLNIELE